MAYNFGTTGTDVITQSLSTPNTWPVGIGLIAGWWYPTTLTAARTYWQLATLGNPARLEVDTTTSNLRYYTGSQTTNGQITATGTPITTNRWWFFAVLSNQPLGTAGLRIWQANETDPPTEMILATSVTPTGSTSVNAITLNIGGQATSNTAFQGDIENIFVVSGSSTPTIGDPLSGIGNSANTISTNEALFIRRRFVDPMWRGNFDVSRLGFKETDGSFIAHFPLVEQSAMRMRRGSTTASTSGLQNLSPTISGPTISSRRSPNYQRPTFRYGQNRPRATR